MGWLRVECVLHHPHGEPPPILQRSNHEIC